jgi:UDP-N-acetylglucosamine 2-epimerase (hydrolysing)
MGVDILKKKIVFLTGTRADFGKMKPLMKAVTETPEFDCTIFVTGMHTLSRYGYTIDEIHKAGFTKTHLFMNQIHGEPMELVLANTIEGLSRFMHECQPDLLVVHGDRVEALAGAIAGALRKVLVVHVEGGELSGTVDEIIRHAVTKLSHLHFVANDEAKDRLRQLGEHPNAIYVIGSPDIDTMLSENLPDIHELKKRYGISFDKYGIALFHPVTTEIEHLRVRAETFVSALIEGDQNFIVIYPNNDEGCENIFNAYAKLEDHPRFKMFPSMRFEYFLCALKNASFIVGNSSAGIREAPVYSVPTINIGNRQKNRFNYKSIINVGYEKMSILEGISKAMGMKDLTPCHYFGDGKSTVRFMNALLTPGFWETPKQKQFCDLSRAKEQAAS